MATDQEFESEHLDNLTLVRQNFDSTKLLTSSIDHRVAVYDVDRPSGKRTLLDVFGAHDAEVRDARWFHTSVGTYFVTIANDLQARIWTQDLSQAPMSGRRFRRIASIKCEQFVPFVSVDVKTVGTHTYVVLVDRQGLLSLYEPSNPDEFSEWSLIDQLDVVSPAPSRGEHTSFKVVFEQDPFPLPYLQYLSSDQTQLTLGVTALNHFKIYRTTAEPNVVTAQTSPQQQASGIGRGASHRLCLFEVLNVQPQYSQAPTSAGLLLRDIAFRPGNIRGSDVIAVACINGTVAIYEIKVRSKQAAESSNRTMQKQTRAPPQAHQSNLTSALHPSAATSQASEQAVLRTSHQFQYSHHATAISILEEAHMDAWSVQWDEFGDVLLSTGTDGTVKIWRRIVSDHTLEGFELIGEQNIEDDSSSEDGSFEESPAKGQ